MTPVLQVFFLGAALSVVGVMCLVWSLFLRAPGVRSRWTQLWLPADSFSGPGRALNRWGFALSVIGSVMVMAALAWHQHLTQGGG